MPSVGAYRSVGTGGDLITMTIRNRSALVALGGGTVLLVAALTGCGSTDVDDAPVEHKSFAYGGKALTIEAENSTVQVVPPRMWTRSR